MSHSVQFQGNRRLPVLEPFQMLEMPRAAILLPNIPSPSTHPKFMTTDNASNPPNTRGADDPKLKYKCITFASKSSLLSHCSCPYKAAQLLMYSKIQYLVHLQIPIMSTQRTPLLPKIQQFVHQPYQEEA